MALVHAHAGRQRKALEIALELEREPRLDYAASVLAAVYASVRHEDRALKILEKLLEERVGVVIYLNSARIYDSLRKLSRFRKLLRRVGLSQVQAGSDSGRWRNDNILLDELSLKLDFRTQRADNSAVHVVGTAGHPVVGFRCRASMRGETSPDPVVQIFDSLERRTSCRSSWALLSCPFLPLSAYDGAMHYLLVPFAYR